MTASTISRTALIISTTPPAPREYGNRNRVCQMIEFLRQSGFIVSFLLYPSDEDWQDSIPSYYHDLAREFDHFAIIPNTKPLHQPARAFHHDIDEWWDHAIGDYLAWLLKRKSFDVLLVNYTFLSRAFTCVPRNVLRILDTHDIFTDRRETLARHGVAPEFFYTNADQERLAFQRADIVIAIKQSEAEFIRSVTDRPVVTIPYWDNRSVPPDFAAIGPCPVFSPTRPLRLGFIGAENSVNIVNMNRFLRHFDRYFQLYDLKVEIIVAGNVCRRIPDGFPFLRKIGHVSDIDEFYREVDAIVAPLDFSTGIKVKVGEALAHRLPVIATANAFDGFASFHPTQCESSISSLCHAITAIACNQIQFRDLLEAADRAAEAARRAQYLGLGELAALMSARLTRILFITDRSPMQRNSFVDESVAQALEYIGPIAPVIVIVAGEQAQPPDKCPINVQYVGLADGRDFPMLLARIVASFNVTMSLVYVTEADCNGIKGALRDYGIEFLHGRYTTEGAQRRLNFLAHAAGSRPIHVSPLRYLPAIARNVACSTLVAVFRPLEISQWQAVILDYVRELCARRGLEVVLITVPARPEHDPGFFHAALSTPAARFVFLTADLPSCLFVLPTMRYRNAAYLVIGEDYIFPQAGDSRSGMPSIVASIDRFFINMVDRRAASGPNAGWSAVRASLIAGHIRNS